jgi:hypothetical protein
MNLGSVIINNFFTTFLRIIAQEINENTYNSESTNRKIKYYTKFIYDHGSMIINSNERLSNYSGIFNLTQHNHHMMATNEKYHSLTHEEKEKAQTSGSRKRYDKIPMENYIHDEIDFLEARAIPTLSRFFNKNIMLFEELQSNISSIE